ncbi:hypothetical protein DA456_00890 [Pseudomonas syringae pv. atrofaciens]|uniref:Uncharacterized protein n=1 Tax=Pseudomonas syringae pv. atrofaciens TaxID=192087 RepID=A0AAD0I5I0_PSESX|nr:hypothetical protein DA456_00890 [Pseudomonas syringae pv. atrofaciens]
MLIVIQVLKSPKSRVFRLLPAGRRSELVREDIVLNAKSSATVRALSRTSSLLRPAARIKRRLLYSAEHCVARD